MRSALRCALRPHGHVAAVLCSLGLERLIARRLLRSRGLHDDTLSRNLGGALGLGEVDEGALYVAVDWLLERQEL